MREYATQMEAAKQGIITPEMKTVAEKEFTDPEIIRERVALGQIAIPANINHKSLCAEGIGKGLRTKINVNLGISGDANNYEAEMDKVRMALRFGAEAIMDLSNYGKTNTFRQQLIELSPAMMPSATWKRTCWISPRRTFSRLSGPTRKKGWIS